MMGGYFTGKGFSMAGASLYLVTLQFVNGSAADTEYKHNSYVLAANADQAVKIARAERMDDYYTDDFMDCTHLERITEFVVMPEGGI